MNLKQFLPYVKKEAKLYLLGFVGSLFRFLIPLLVPLILKYVFDNLLQNIELTYTQKIEQLVMIAVSMLVVFLFIRTTSLP